MSINIGWFVFGVIGVVVVGAIVVTGDVVTGAVVVVAAVVVVGAIVVVVVAGPVENKTDDDSVVVDGVPVLKTTQV